MTMSQRLLRVGKIPVGCSELPTELGRWREACLVAHECGPNWPYTWKMELSFLQCAESILNSMSLAFSVGLRAQERAGWDRPC